MTTFLIILGCLGFCYLVQVIGVLGALSSLGLLGFDSKKDFWLNCIPFYWIVLIFNCLKRSYDVLE
jgi:hypothetical protein